MPFRQVAGPLGIILTRNRRPMSISLARATRPETCAVRAAGTLAAPDDEPVPSCAIAPVMTLLSSPADLHSVPEHDDSRPSGQMLFRPRLHACGLPRPPACPTLITVHLCGDYVMTVKGNAPETFALLEGIDWQRDRTGHCTGHYTESLDRTHGQLEQRRIDVMTPLGGLINYPGVLPADRARHPLSQCIVVCRMSLAIPQVRQPWRGAPLANV